MTYSWFLLFVFLPVYDHIFLSSRGDMVCCQSLLFTSQSLIQHLLYCFNIYKSSSFPKMTKRALEYVSTGQRRRHGLWSATILFVFEVTLYSRLCLLKVCAPLFINVLFDELLIIIIICKTTKISLEFVSLGQRRRHGLWSAASTQDSSSPQQLGFS